MGLWRDSEASGECRGWYRARIDELPGTSPWTAEYRARRYDSTRVKIPLPNF